jgi:hypothetical protein
MNNALSILMILVILSSANCTQKRSTSHFDAETLEELLERYSQGAVSVEDDVPGYNAQVQTDLLKGHLHLKVLESLDREDIYAAKRRLVRDLLVTVQFLPTFIEQGEHSEATIHKARTFARHLLKYFEHYFTAHPEAAFVPKQEGRFRESGVVNGLVGLRSLLTDQEDLKRLSNLMIQLYGTDDLKSVY